MGTTISSLLGGPHNGNRAVQRTKPIRSTWDLVEKIDSFPYYADSPAEYEVFMQDYYFFVIEGYPKPLGLVRRNVIDSVPWPSYWSIDHRSRRIRLTAPIGPKGFDKRTKLLRETVRIAKEHGEIEELRMGGELQAVYTAKREHVCNMDMAGWQIFGLIAFGVHLIAWRRCPVRGRFYWLQRRSWRKTVHPGKLDMMAGGGLQIGETARDAMAREAFEEASIPTKYSLKHLRACGVVSYHLSWSYLNNPGSFPHVLYMFEMELPWHIVPRRHGGDEVHEFVSMTEAQVMASLFEDDFKPILGIQWIDHFCRNGRLTVDNEPKLVEISARLHRNLELAPIGEE